MNRIPQHVAIIMDGNGRWAQRRGRPRVFGHIRGSSRIREIVEAADRLGVKALTLYAFSTENWNRPEGELQVLWKLLKKFLKREENRLAKNQVRLRILGEVERLGTDVREVLDPVVSRLSQNTGLQLSFAVSYGARRELVRAAQLFSQECVRGRWRPEDLTEELFSSFLWTGSRGSGTLGGGVESEALPDVDLVIRSSGEIRVSNFLLWQAAYAEFVFLEKCWPDFEVKDLEGALTEYARRDRRFGGVKK